MVYFAKIQTSNRYVFFIFSLNIKNGTENDLLIEKAIALAMCPIPCVRCMTCHVNLRAQ